MPLNLTKANQEELLTMALSLTGSRGWHQDAVAFAARRNGATAPCCIGVFQNFAAGEAEWHFGMAGEKISRAVIEAFLVLAFHPRFLGLSRVYAPISATNKAAQRAALAVGFDFEYRKRGGMAGGADAIVFSISPDASGLAAAIGTKRNAA